MKSSAGRVLSPHERRLRNREQMLQAIRDSAREIMREQGVAALNLNEVARRVGVKPPSLYEYFSGKSALYDDLFRLGLRLYGEQSDRAQAGTRDGWERIRAAIESYMSFAQCYPELWTLVFERPVPGFVPSEESMAESRTRLAMASRWVEDAINRREIEPGVPPDRARDFVIAVMHGLAAAHMANEPHLPLGRGRFGSLVPVAMRVLELAWTPRKARASEEESPHGPN